MEAELSLSELSPDATIGRITAANDTAGELLASIGLSISQHEDETLRSVCQQLQWNEEEVMDWVKKHSNSFNGQRSTPSEEGEPAPDFTLGKWADYLNEHFISPNQALLEEIKQSVPRVHQIHGNQYPWLKNMQHHFATLRESLEMYYKFELEKFFPLIRRLTNNHNGNRSYGTVRQLEKSFPLIQHDHDRMLRQMRTLREKSRNFRTPANACTTLRIQNKNFTLLFSKLKQQFDLEADHLLPAIKQELTTTT